MKYTMYNKELGCLPFKCKRCGNHYCTKHRLPEDHKCEERIFLVIPYKQSPGFSK
ncbi:hypothetical protein GF352_03975 [archaeon]|nr:hypothetical protein [archaeon]